MTRFYMPEIQFSCKFPVVIIKFLLDYQDECWIHTKSSDFTGSSSVLNGYDSYKKSQTCVTGTGSTGGCVITFTTVEGASSLGGTRVNNVNTVQACLDWCEARTECGALDFNNANECYWHNNGDWENNLRTGSSTVTPVS